MTIPNRRNHNSYVVLNYIHYQEMLRVSKKVSYRYMIIKAFLVIFLGSLVIIACTEDQTDGQAKLTQHENESVNPKTLHKEVGKASWYGPGFQGKETANGENFDQNDMTAAHPSLPMGTYAKVTNLENGKQVQVTINDRGPYAENRVIDLSHAAAKKLNMLGDGTAKVRIETKSKKKKVSAKPTRNSKKGAKKTVAAK
jgi:rare lipoprotein A